MAITGEPRHFHTKFKFQLEIGFDCMQFQACSELKAEIAKIEYYEGGVIRPYKEPGRMNVADLTIDRAVTADSDMYRWLLDTANASTNSGLRSREFKKDGYIVQYDRDNTVLRRWQIYQMWPTSVTLGSWDNNSDEMTMEQIVLAFDYFVMRENNKRGNSTRDGIHNAVSGVANALGLR